MKIRNNIGMKLTACVLTVALIGGTAGASAYAVMRPDNVNDKEAVSESVNKEVSADTQENNTFKEETVYILANADGSVKKIIVSDWLKNVLNSGSMSDYTELNDIINVKGDESYSEDADTVLWDAEGNDIYYQGTIEKALPVDMSIHYILDGKEVTAEEAAGKSGKMTIRFEYTNNQKETVKIDGKDTDIYVPFIMITGMILDNDVFKNVEVTNGKLLTDGDKSIAAGFALPGMQESLNIDEDKLEIPDSFEITADVENFELTATLTIATNEIFNKADIDEDADMDDITEAVHKLGDAAAQLLDGSGALYDGLSTLYDKSGELVSGVDQLTAGAKSLNEGADSLYSGSNDLAAGADTLSNGINALNEGVNILYSGSNDLAAGADSLNAGLSQLAANSDSLNSGAKTVFDSLLSMADSQLAAAGLSVQKLTIDNYASVLDGVMASLDETTVRNMAYNTALEKVTAAVHAQDAQIEAQVTAAVRAQVLEGVLSAVGKPMTSEQYSQACAAGLIDSETQAQIEAAVSAQMESEDIKAAIKNTSASKAEELIAQNMQSADVQAQIEAAVTSAKNGQGSIASLKAQLDSYNQFYTGLLSYTGGVNAAYSGSSQLAAGAHSLMDGAKDLAVGSNQLAAGAGSLVNGSRQLTDGSKQLADGSKTLYNGTASLQAGSGALVDGVSQLTDGAKQLTDGMKEFSEEGIQKIIDAFDGDLSELTARMKAIADVSRKYNSFAGISDKTEGNVKFIYRTDSIE